MNDVSKKSLVVIPARGGSKGIPRKNLRPVAGFPLIYYSITAALQVSKIGRVVVTTDDDEIALFAERFGASVILRPADLSDDRATLDPVIAHAAQASEKKYLEQYDFIVTVQPTSPLITAEDIFQTLSLLEVEQKDTVLSAVDDRHLCWTIQNDKTVPTYTKRVNRQELPLNYRETGAVVACTRNQLHTGSRFGSNVGIYEVPHERSFDIDNYSDLYLCESMLQRKKIVITIVGYPKVGLGHAFRGIMLAHELVRYEVIFICEERSALAAEYIKSQNYPVIMTPDDELAKTVVDQSPSLIINDVLDTGLKYMNALRVADVPIVNFEDMGKGSCNADLVVNALYPHQVEEAHILVGEKYFCLRDEFLYLKNKVNKTTNEKVQEILISFGGVDEGDLTSQAIIDIAAYCAQCKIRVVVIVGPGYKYIEDLQTLVKAYDELECSIISKTKRISDYMCEADIAITSAGRTVLELAAVNCPMIVICQNEREMTHTFASPKNGIINLGSRLTLKPEEIKKSLKLLCENMDARLKMVSKMTDLDLSRGKERVISKILSLL